MKILLAAAALFAAPASAQVPLGYAAYAAKCAGEVKAAGKDAVQCLSIARYVQVAAAVDALKDRPQGPRLAHWLESGFILEQDFHDSSIAAETRRDGSSRNFLSVDAVSDNTCLDGNIYLNPKKEFLFFSPSELKKAAADAERLEAGLKSLAPARQEAVRRAARNKRMHADAKVSQLYLRSVLVHEAVHTEQRYGTKSGKESGAYDAQLAFLADSCGKLDKAFLNELIDNTYVDRSNNTGTPRDPAREKYCP